jgi:hypothetical protein
MNTLRLWRSIIQEDKRKHRKGDWYGFSRRPSRPGVGAGFMRVNGDKAVGVWVRTPYLSAHVSRPDWWCC